MKDIMTTVVVAVIACVLCVPTSHAQKRQNNDYELTDSVSNPWIEEVPTTDSLGNRILVTKIGYNGYTLDYTLDVDYDQQHVPVVVHSAEEFAKLLETHKFDIAITFECPYCNRMASSECIFYDETKESVVQRHWDFPSCPHAMKQVLKPEDYRKTTYLHLSHTPFYMRIYNKDIKTRFETAYYVPRSCIINQPRDFNLVIPFVSAKGRREFKARYYAWIKGKFKQPTEMPKVD